MIAGTRLIRRIVKMPALAAITDKEIFPSNTMETDDDIISVARDLMRPSVLLPAHTFTDVIPPQEKYLLSNEQALSSEHRNNSVLGQKVLL